MLHILLNDLHIFLFLYPIQWLALFCSDFLIKRRSQSGPSLDNIQYLGVLNRGRLHPGMPSLNIQEEKQNLSE